MCSIWASPALDHGEPISLMSSAGMDRSFSWGSNVAFAHATAHPELGEALQHWLAEELLRVGVGFGVTHPCQAGTPHLRLAALCLVPDMRQLLVVNWSLGVGPTWLGVGGGG